MATAHALSVFTNSRVHQPINPQNGLTNTLHERPIAVWEEEHDTYDDEGQKGSSSRGAGSTPLPLRAEQTPRSSVNHLRSSISPRDPMIESLTKDLSNLTDDEFYRKLQELKAEHKKTVAMCEQAYREAASASASVASGSRTAAAASVASAAVLRASADQVRDMSRPPLPPEARQRHAWAQRSHSSEVVDGDSSSEADTQRQRRRSTSRSPVAGGGMRSRSGSLSSSMSAGMARVEDMWENFRVDDYAPRSHGSGSRSSLMDSKGSKQKRPGSAASSSNKENSNKEWSPKITMPKPFRMTVRDEAKTTKKRTKAQEELDKSIREKQLQEEAECQKKFKATPAPANIYLPLYDEIVEHQQTRRDLNHLHRSELLRSMEKPFKFLQREEQKKRSKRTQSMPTAPSADSTQRQTKFKAQPVPKEVQEEMLDRLAEEEEYRRIRMRMRAEDMLRSARLPPSMEARKLGRATAARASESEDGDENYRGNDGGSGGRRCRSELLPGEPTFRPKIKHEVPDFEELHRKQQWELAKRKEGKEATITKPFTLLTDRIASHQDKIQYDMDRDEKMLAELRWPYKNPRTKPKNIGTVIRSPDQIPATQTTASTEMRKSSTKEKLREMARRELEELEAERRSREYDRKLKSAISEKVAANEVIYNLKDQSAEKLRRYRAEERARQEEYQKHLDEMKQRVESRPLLFEMVTQKNARMQAEKKYEKTIKSAGLQDRFVREHAAAANNEEGHASGDDDGSEAGSYRESLRHTSRLAEARRPPLSKEETGLSTDSQSPEEDSDA